MNAALLGVAGYFVLGVLGFIVPKPRLTSALALTAGTISFACWLPGFPTGYLGIGDWAIPWLGDPLAATFWGLALFLHFVILLGQDHPRQFYPLLTLLIGTTLSAVLSQDLFNLYVALELSSLIAFLLVGMEGKPAQVWASLKYLILTSCGMTLYLLGVGFVYGELGTLSLVEIAGLGMGLGDRGLTLGVGLLLAGAAAKGGVFLYALWLPLAHGYAPAPVSALLSGVVVKMGIVALARISAAFPVSEVLVGLGLVTGLLGAIHALWEPRLKVFLAYSTTSQLGYLLLGFGFGAWRGALAYAVAHGLVKGLLFLAAGRAEKEGTSHLISRLPGKLSGETRALLALGTLAIVGFPPLAGYPAKGLLAAGAPPWGKWALAALALATAAYFAKLLPLLLGGGPWPRPRYLPGWLLGAAVVGTGLWGLIALPEMRAPPQVLFGMGLPLMGFLVQRVLARLPLRLPRWRLDEAFTALLVAGTGLALWLLLR